MADEIDTIPAPTDYAVGDRISHFGREYECIEVGIVTGKVARSGRLWRRVEYAPVTPALGGGVTFSATWDYVDANAIRAAFAENANWQSGHSAALFGFARRWREPDAWHRGYLAGLLKRYKSRKRGEPMVLTH